MRAEDSRDAYFLTRHHAHLLEALDQAVRQPGSVSVIHGATGLGKTRLLQAFLELRCVDRAWLCVTCLPQGLAQIQTPDHEHPVCAQHELQKTLEATGRQCSLWIVDQFELALPHGRAALYDAAQSMEQPPAMVLSGHLDWPESWRDLLPECCDRLYAADVQALSDEESRDFLDRMVCHDPGLGLRRDRRLRHAIRACAGRIPLLREMAEDFSQQDCVPIADHKPVPKKWGLAVAMVLILLAVYGLLQDTFWQQPQPAPPVSQEQSRESLPRSQTESVIPVPEADGVVEPRPEPVEPEPPPAPPPAMSAPAPDDLADPFRGFARWPLLHDRLRQTRQWLKAPDATGWSIQVMTLKANDRMASSLESYLKRMQQAGESLEQFWVYTAPARPELRPDHLGVLYGRYPSRQAAQAASSRLPARLGADRPLLRSASSLRRESGLTTTQ